MRRKHLVNPPVRGALWAEMPVSFSPLQAQDDLPYFPSCSSRSFERVEDEYTGYLHEFYFLKNADGYSHGTVGQRDIKLTPLRNITS
jgi:hypothetical protein